MFYFECGLFAGMILMVIVRDIREIKGEWKDFIVRVRRSRSRYLDSKTPNSTVQTDTEKEGSREPQ